MLDVVILVPFQGEEALWLEPVLRRRQGPASALTFLAQQRLERAVGRDLKEGVPRWVAGHRYRPRTAGAISLASSAERAGLRWHAIDPGVMSLAAWRKRLVALRSERPALVALNTTFLTEARYLHLFCAMVKRVLPGARLALGGYYYATDARAFLGAPADIFCVGEGEERLGQIALRVRDGRPLDDVPGLFLRDGEGRLHSTGTAPALDMEALPVPDWSLSARMDPAIDPEQEPLLYNIETQRGCYFKCEFCTYRTLAEHRVMSPERAAEVLLHTGRTFRGRSALVDATATFPKDRFQRMLEVLEAGGASPHPIGAFARASDMDDALCARMARVGMRHLFVGQESGDQGVLNLMRKGTRVDRVRPALDAMSRHGIKACFGFIAGFPGEDAAAASRTREMMLHLNDGYDEPVVLIASIDVFAAQDMAAVSGRVDLGSYEHPFDYRNVALSSDEASYLRLDHYLALAESPSAPATGFGITPMLTDIANVYLHGGDFRAGFRWLKAYDRGMALFLRNELYGTPVDRVALHEVRTALAAELESAPAIARQALPRQARTWITRALRSEWQREAATGPGVLTRLLAASGVWQALAEPRAAAMAFSTARPPEPREVSEEAVALRAGQAASLVELSRRPPARKPARATLPLVAAVAPAGPAPTTGVVD